MIQLQHVDVSLDQFQLHDLHFTIPKGCTIGCIGRNGAGKTTLLRTMLGLYLPTKGDILWEGAPLTTAMKERIGFVYDDLFISKEAKVKSLRKRMRIAYPTWNDEQFTMLLKQFEIDEKKKIKTLSKGMKMKVQIALALSHSPDILLMDEPTAGLDPVFRRQLLMLLNDWMDEKEQRTLFFSTHITSDLEQFADYILLIDEGRIRLFLSMDELEEQYALVKGPAPLLSQYEELFEAVEVRHGQFTALYNPKRANLQAPLVTERAHLEDILYFLTEVE